jgi:hypothetical protein
MKCHYCGYQNDTHDSLCPKPGTVAMEIWNRGFRDGRAGKDCASHSLESYHRLYQMGWNQGNIALEEAANGHDGRFDWGE